MRLGKVKGHCLEWTGYYARPATGHCICGQASYEEASSNKVQRQHTEHLREVRQLTGGHDHEDRLPAGEGR